MTDKERKSLMKEIENCRKWMIDTSGYSEEDLTVADLIEDDGDIYEAFVVIHLINGECIALRNHCYRSFMIKMYSGDFLNYCRGEQEDSIEVMYFDANNNDICHQCKIPLSSVCYIEYYHIRLNWQNLSKLQQR